MIDQEHGTFFEKIYFADEQVWRKPNPKPAITEGVPEFVPSQSTAKISFFISTLALQSYNVMLLGPTGTSKTSCTKNFTRALGSELWETGSQIFSATTKPTSIEDYVFDHTEK